MKTDDLIRALSADKEPTGPAPGLALALAAAAGLVVSVLIFLWLVPIRPNLGEAIRTFPFMLKPIEMGIDGISSHQNSERVRVSGRPTGLKCGEHGSAKFRTVVDGVNELCQSVSRFAQRQAT